MQKQPIETAPQDGRELILFTKDGKPYAPCIWQKEGDISEDSFWLWWQSEPEYFVEIKNVTHWIDPKQLE